MASSPAKPRIKVGQEIFFSIGKNRFHGKVIEDRGNLGVNKERILRIALDMGEDIPLSEHEVPERELEIAA